MTKAPCLDLWIVNPWQRRTTAMGELLEQQLTIALLSMCQPSTTLTLSPSYPLPLPLPLPHQSLLLVRLQIHSDVTDWVSSAQTLWRHQIASELQDSFALGEGKKEREEGKEEQTEGGRDGEKEGERKEEREGGRKDGSEFEEGGRKGGS